MNFRTRTPKGDGNGAGRRERGTYENFRTRTPKGDGNEHIIRAVVAIDKREFQNTNPERGRKRRWTSVRLSKP